MMNFRKNVRILFLISFSVAMFTSGLLAQEDEYIRSYLTINDGLSPHKVPSRKAFKGKCLLIIQSNGEKGQIEVEAKSDGLQTSVVKIMTK